MNFKFFLIIYLQLIYSSLANLKLTTSNVTLPTKTKTLYVDMMKFEKRVINDSSPLILQFNFEARDNIVENITQFFFNGNLINFEARKDIKYNDTKIKGKKLFELTFQKFTENVAGEYTLVITATNGYQINATAHIFSPPFLKEFKKSERSTEGSRMEVGCKYLAHPMKLDSLSWTSAPPRTNANYRVSSSNGSVFDDVIVWDILEKKDAGYYRCEARNEYGNDTVIMQLRVKDRLAPLWPFIGIVIEIVILLCVIIFYEKQKSSKKSAEKETNPIRESLLPESKHVDRDDSVTHRKTMD